jgi:hypothetical protein
MDEKSSTRFSRTHHPFQTCAKYVDPILYFLSGSLVIAIPHPVSCSFSRLTREIGLLDCYLLLLWTHYLCKVQYFGTVQSHIRRPSCL